MGKKKAKPKKTIKPDSKDPKPADDPKSIESDFGGFPDRDLKKNLGCG
jgi:hypothetical protein